MITWHTAVRNALHRYTMRHKTNVVTRQGLIDEELETIIQEVQSTGKTPAQTLSRVLQELRDAEVLYFFGDGYYLLLDQPVNIELDDLPDDAIDIAIQKNKLHMGVIKTNEQQALVRQRRGQSRLRKLTLKNYAHQCAFCDLGKMQLLVASHIVRWADDPLARGNLNNVMCLCRFHDTLFEYGYFSLSDDYHVVKKEPDSEVVARLLALTHSFRPPMAFPPSPKFLQAHRIRVGLEK